MDPSDNGGVTCSQVWRSGAHHCAEVHNVLESSFIKSSGRIRGDYRGATRAQSTIHTKKCFSTSNRL